MIRCSCIKISTGPGIRLLLVRNDHHAKSHAARSRLILIQAAPQQLAPLVLGPQTTVADVLQRYPQALDIFLRHGFAPLQNPVLRRTMARVVTLEQACRREGADLNRLLADLMALIEAEQKARTSTPESREAFSV